MSCSRMISAQPVVICNEEMCADVCEDGSIELDSWVTGALALQRRLQDNRTLSAVEWIGTHNALISRANGFGRSEDTAMALMARSHLPNATTVRVANQRHGLLDLLAMGVRHVEIDMWWLWGDDIHICHSPVPDPLYVLDVDAAASAANVTRPAWSPQRELCSNITFTSVLSGIRAWLEAPGNEREFVALFLDDRVPPALCNRTLEDVTAVLGPLLFTPRELNETYGGAWPSRSALLAAGRRVFVESDDYFRAYPASFGETIFYPTTWAAVQQGPLTTAPFPACTIAGDAAWYAANAWVRILDGSVVWPPDHDERQGGIIAKPDGLADLAACGVTNIAVSDLGPADLPGLVWSWAAGEPRAVAGCAAAAMTLVRGRWTAQPCARALPALCRLGDVAQRAGHLPGSWRITPPVAWEAAPAACAALGAGWAFDVPRDGRENALVASRALDAGLWYGATPGLWLNVPLPVSPCQ